VKKGILIIAAALLALACKEDVGTTPGPDAIPDATSPVNVLKCTEISFNRADIRIIVDVLSSKFVFHFDPDDVGQNPPGSNYVIPESWSEAEFRGAVSNMYTNAYSISLTIPTAGVGEPEPNATIYKAENISIRLLVMVDEVNGYIADSGYCDFEFGRYDGEEGQQLWRLRKWWDRTSSGGDANPAVKPTSLGKVLSLYH